jgi:radical SAM protein with 4Fe4S-binding SPASM domain
MPHPGRSPGLREFKLEVTHRCALNCLHCSSDARPSNSREMGRDDCLRVIAEAAAMGAEEVAFSGGEPLLWSALPDAVAAAAGHALKVTVYTSGNADQFGQRASRLRELGASLAVFSVFGPTAVSHERVTRMRGSFARTTAAMHEARALGLSIELHFVPMAGTYRDLPEIACLAREHGASRLSVLRLVPQGRAALVPGRILSRVQNLELRRQILALRAEHGDSFVRTGSPYNFLMLSDQPACRAAMDRLTIGPDLHLYPCDAFKGIRASEVVRTEEWSCLCGASLFECWRRSPYLEAVRTQLAADFGAPCRSCGLLQKCASGCLAQKAIANGSLKKGPDPDCLGPEIAGGSV